MGRTGSGKSTIFLSILRILEAQNGNIIIDGIKIDDLGLYDLRKKITIIAQDPMLFKGTIRENLDLMNEFEDKKIWEILDMICLSQKFEIEGLKTEVYFPIFYPLNFTKN